MEAIRYVVHFETGNLSYVWWMGRANKYIMLTVNVFVHCTLWFCTNIILMISKTVITVILYTADYKKKIEIWPIYKLLEVLEFTTFSFYLVFQFEWHSNLGDIPIWVTFQF